MLCAIRAHIRSMPDRFVHVGWRGSRVSPVKVEICNSTQPAPSDCMQCLRVVSKHIVGLLDPEPKPPLNTHS